MIFIVFMSIMRTSMAVFRILVVAMIMMAILN